jgi:hypothetical protein
LLAEWRSDEECTCDEDAEDEKQAAHILRELAFELKGHMPRTRLRLPAIRTRVAIDKRFRLAPAMARNGQYLDYAVASFIHRLHPGP